MANINIVMRYFEISESSSQEEERLKRAREQGFNVDDPHYHGTPGGDFDEFDPYRTADEDLAYGAGIYMSRDPDAASGYSRPGTSWGNHTDDARPTVYKVYHRVKNPFDMSKFYPYAEVKRIMEHCFTEDELESIPFWQEIQEEVQYSGGSSGELEELHDMLFQITENFADFDGKPDPNDYEDGENDEEYIADLADAIAYEKKSLEQRIKWLEERYEKEYEDHKKMVATGRKGSALGKEIYRTLWTNTSEYHDWKAESQLFGGETETFEFKTEANRWLEELGYDGLTHVDRYNPGNKGVSHNVTIAFHPQQVRSAHANFDPEKIDSPKLSESYQEGPDDAFVDGKTQYRINDIFKYTEKALVFDVPISKLKWQMEKEDDEDRINRADCSVPILVWKKGNRLICVDGMHRLQKAVRLGLPTLPAKYVLDTIMKKARITEGQKQIGLNELARPKTRVQADEILRNAGYSRLGNGAFGAVYRKPGKPYVLKVFTAKDQAYRDFVALAMAHKNNPHFPRFIGNIVHVTPDICAIRMEPLTPYKHNHSLITMYLRWRDYKSSDPNNFISIELENAKEILTPKIKRACDLIIDNLMTRYACDLKQENLMMRGSTIVFTDPVSSNPEDSGVVLSSQPHKSTYNSADDALLNKLYDLKESYHPEMISNENIPWTKSAKKNAELAASLLRKAGFKAMTENPSGNKTNSKFAAIGSKTNGILVNPRCGYWKDPVAAAQLNFKVGHLSTDHPLGVLLHEIAHIIYDAPDNWFTNLHKEVAKRVSKYAASNPKEFVSEVYAGINTGKTYDDEVMKFYNMYARK